MRYFVEITDKDFNLSPAQRTRLGLAVDDPRDAFVEWSVTAHDMDGTVRCVDSGRYIFTRAGTTRSAIKTAVEAACASVITADRDSVGLAARGGLVGMRWQVG